MSHLQFPKKPIRILGLDLDGTTLDSRKKLPERNRDAIAAAIRAGVMVLPATGRNQEGILPEILDIPGIRYLLTSNGARIYDLQEQKVLLHRWIGADDVRRIWQMFQGIDAAFEAYVDGGAFLPRSYYEKIDQYSPDAAASEYFKKIHHPVDDFPAFLEKNLDRVEKFNLMFLDAGQRARMLEEFSGWDSISTSFASWRNIEINGRGVDKGSALLLLGEQYGISRDEIMACGDSSNDEQMLRKVGFSVAMDNALPEIKQICDVQTLSNDECGVAEAIHKYILL